MTPPIPIVRLFHLGSYHFKDKRIYIKRGKDSNKALPSTIAIKLETERLEADLDDIELVSYETEGDYDE